MYEDAKEKVKKPIKVGLPTITVFSDHLNITVLLLKNGCDFPATAIRSCKLVDHFGVEYTSNSAFIPPLGSTHSARLTMDITHNTYLAGARFTFDILTSLGKRISVSFLCKNHNRPECEYLESAVTTMDTVDERDFFRIKAECEAKPEPTPPIPAPPVPVPQISGLEPYIKAVYREMYYLKDHGGRKYKVVNGQYINKTGASYAYSFELESEAFFADDAQVSLTYAGGTVDGTVLETDGFDITLLLDNNIGSRIVSAYLSADPWKLLDSLANKLSALPKGRRIAEKLLQEGPHLSQPCELSQIPKGQAAARDHVQNHDITVIWGPPGTGKTHTMSELAISFLLRNKTVLIVSHSNVSVDGVILKIEEQLKERNLGSYLQGGRVLRYGYVRDRQLTGKKEIVAYHYALENAVTIKQELRKIDKELDTLSGESQEIKSRRVELVKQRKSLNKQIKDQEKLCAGKAQLLATTISKVYADSLFDHKTYDVVMFDEASMAYVPQVIFAASCADEKLICVGDFRQLAPIVQSDAKKLLSRDLFSFLGISDGGDRIMGHPWLVMLNEQFRMDPAISSFANSAVYSRLLTDHSSVLTKHAAIKERGPFSGSAMNLIDLTGTYCAADKNSDNSRFNILGALISFSAAQEACLSGESNIGMITPYAAQARLLRAMIRDEGMGQEIACSTVHQFQGSERNLIIFDAVESYPSTKPGWLMSKDDNGSVMRLINVAVTRARGKLILVANRGYWRNKYAGTQHTLFKLINKISDDGNTIGVKNHKLQDYLSSASYGKQIHTYLSISDSMKTLEKDIQHARSEIIISIPCAKQFGVQEDFLIQCIRKAMDNGVMVKCKSSDMESLPKTWKDISLETDETAFPMISIDKKVLWYGIPMENGVFFDGTSGFKTVCPMIARFTGKQTVEVILALSDMNSRTLHGTKTSLFDKNGKDERNNPGGLAKYIAQTQRCSKCRCPMVLVRSWQNKFYLKCSNCEEKTYLRLEQINDYIDKYDVRCPKCNGKIVARIGTYGPYIRCENDHFSKPGDI